MLRALGVGQSVEDKAEAIDSCAVPYQREGGQVFIHAVG
jgi:hypothetical protein